MYYTVRINSILHDVQVTCCKQVVGSQYSIVSVCFCDNISNLEVLAALLPDLFTLRLAITIVIVVRCTPEVRLDTKAFSEVFSAVHLIRSNEAALLVEYKLHLRRRNLYFIAFSGNASLTTSLVCGYSQRFDWQAELFRSDFMTYRNQNFRFCSSHPEVHEIFSTGLWLQASYVYIQLL